MERDRRLLYFFLDGHAHVWIDSGAAGRVVFAESFVRALNVIDRNI